MKFTIVGAGALGTIIGAHLANAGHDVTMVARGARAQAVRREGLQVRGLAELSVQCEIVEDTSTLGRTDVLMFAVKTHQMDAALAGLSHVEATSVFSVANGVMKNEQLADVFGAARVMGCMADTSGELHGDGIAEFTRNVCLSIGPYQPPTKTHCDDIAHAIASAGVVTRAVDNIATVEWSKFVAWIALFSLSVVARRPTGQFLSNREFATIAVRQVKEAAAIAAHLGIVLSNDAPMPVVHIFEQAVEAGIARVLEAGRVFLDNAPTHRMSSLQDLEAGRRLEVDGTLGYLVRKARGHGIPVPTLDMSYELAAGIDALQAVD